MIKSVIKTKDLATYRRNIEYLLAEGFMPYEMHATRHTKHMTFIPTDTNEYEVIYSI